VRSWEELGSASRTELVRRTGKLAEAVARRIQKLAGQLRTDIGRRSPLKPWAQVKPGALDTVHDILLERLWMNVEIEVGDDVNYLCFGFIVGILPVIPLIRDPRGEDTHPTLDPLQILAEGLL
jgi:hypothetical protein